MRGAKSLLDLQTANETNQVPNTYCHLVRQIALQQLLNICTGDAERMRIFLNAYISMIFYDKLMKFFLFAILFS